MKNNPSFRAIIQADLQHAASAEFLLWRLRRWPDIELVHHFEPEMSLMIFAATYNAQDCEDLVTRLRQLEGLDQVRAHYLFPRITKYIISDYQPRTWQL